MMLNVVLIVSFLILILLVWKFWRPYVEAPKRVVPEGTGTLYFFYADWCGWSQKAMPEWEKLEQSLPATFGTTNVSAKRVNVEDDRKLAMLYNVEGFPTIKLETETGVYTYKGERTADALLQFLRESLGKERSGL